MVNYCVQNSLPFVPILSQMKPVKALQSNVSRSLFYIILWVGIETGYGLDGPGIESQ